MAPIPKAAFAARLRGLSPDQFAEFVAALWEAREYDTRITGDRVYVSRDGDQRELLIHHVAGHWRNTLDRLPGEWGSTALTVSDADIVVTTASAGRTRRLDAAIETRVIGIDTLRELLLYAIDPQQGDTIARQYLDRPARGPDEATTTDWTATHGSRIAVLGAIALTVLVLTGGIIGTPGMTGVFGIGAQPIGNGTSGTPIETPQAPSTSPATATVSMTPTSEPTPLPPGLNATGLIDPEALIDAHMETIVGRSYTWTLTYQVFVRNARSVERREVVRVRRQSRYVTNVSGNTRKTDRADPTATVSAYGGGGFRYTKRETDNETRYQRTALTYRNDRSRYAVRSRVLLAKFLWGNHSARVSETQRDGDTVYILTLVDSTTDEDVSTTTTAVIEPNGFIRSLRWKSVATGQDQISVVISFRYTDVGATTVESPPWLAAAKNATGPG